MQYYGIRGAAHTLIKNYLSSKKQFVSIKHRNIEIGVSQGFILGLLLFLIYINDLGNAALSKPCLFADDTYLVLSNSSLSKLEDNCNMKLNNFKKWCNAKKSKINHEKSAVVLFSPKLNLQTGKLDVTYNNNPIICLSSSKHLGIFIELNFKSHIEPLVSKISRSIAIPSKLRFLFNSSTLHLLYYSFVYSHLILRVARPNPFYTSYRNYKIKQFKLSHTPKQNPQNTSIV